MPEAEESVNPKTGMTSTEMKEFVRNHWEELDVHLRVNM
jgi:hypothetical protein